MPAHLGEMVEVVLVQVVEQQRRGPHHLARAGVVGVEGAQRVQLDPRAHLRRELRARWLAGGPGGARDTRRAPRGCRGWTAAGAQPGTPISASSVAEQDDRLGVDGRVLGADRLGPDLPELAVAARPGGARGGRSSTGTRASRAGGACACRARCRRGRPARCPPGAASASARSRRRRRTSPWRRCPSTRRRRGRTARSTRRRASRCARSRRRRAAPWPWPRAPRARGPARR